jgi:hypothetical protein
MSIKTLKAGDIIRMPHYMPATSTRPAGSKIFTCIVVYLPDATGQKRPYLRCDQFGTVWFKPHASEKGGYGYKMTRVKEAQRLELLYLKQIRKAKTA